MKAILALFVALSAFAAEPYNLSGTWLLDIKQSKWNNKPRPNKVTLTIEHNEPKLKYSGTVVDAKEAEEKFTFEGAIDGKEYTVRENDVERKVVFKRLSPATITSTITSGDGKTEETATTTLSKDGKSLVRRMTYKGPEGRQTWTEVYQRSS